MGNAIEKQKPLKRSHLCPWKQDQKMQFNVVSGNLRVSFEEEEARGTTQRCAVRRELEGLLAVFQGTRPSVRSAAPFHCP
ncbi:hypothetical protein CB1_000576091 [Camelus ferus]|nr:hypothetical protein CB1_000576091 [Camelus ferus]